MGNGLKLEPLVDATGEEISPGIYAVAPAYIRAGKHPCHLTIPSLSDIPDDSDLLAVQVAAAGFHYASRKGEGNILDERVAETLVRCPEDYLRERARRLEGQAEFIRNRLDFVRKHSTPQTP